MSNTKPEGSQIDQFGESKPCALAMGQTERLFPNQRSSMNPISRYFAWHDAMYLARAQDQRKNLYDIRMFRVLRPVLLTILLASMTAMGLALFKLEWFPSHMFMCLVFVLAFSALSYTWVTEALLFRQYVEQHRHDAQGE